MKLVPLFILLLMASASFAQKQRRMMVNFDFDKYAITTVTAARLDSLVAVLPAKKEGLKIELYGHCDSIGNNEYNDELSHNRVEAIKKYLGDRGLDSAIVQEVGFGKRRPLNDNFSDSARAVNRRVELVITLPHQKLLTKAIEDTTTKVGSKLTLENLNFWGDGYDFMPQSMPVLKELLAVMRRFPTLVIAIEGHICCIRGKGDVTTTKGIPNLSQARAREVYNYLVANGISPKRLSYVGFGHQFPIFPFPEKDDDEKLANRRVEIRIVSR